MHCSLKRDRAISFDISRSHKNLLSSERESNTEKDGEKDQCRESHRLRVAHGSGTKPRGLTFISGKQ
jgi:hypothetical protein